MASITPCCKKLLNRLLHLLCVLALFGAAAQAHAQAGSIETRKAVIQQNEDGAMVSADFSIDLSDRLEESLQHGITLIFNLEFELTRPRWWWTNEQIVSRLITYRLSYAALTRQYKLSAGNQQFSFNTLEEALANLSVVRDWLVVEKSVLRVGDTYAAAIRLSLDRGQLPKPLQVDALTNRDWQMDSKVHRWNYTAVAPAVSATFSNEAKP